MAEVANKPRIPEGWEEALAESEADIEAGRIVSGDVVMQDLLDCLARMEAEAAFYKPADIQSRDKP